MTALAGLNVGFVSARSASVVDGFWTEAGVGRLLDIWQQDARRLTVAMSLAPGRQRWHDHRCADQSFDFVPLPWLPSVARGFYKAPGCWQAIRLVERVSDVVIVQLPFAATLGLLFPARPRLYHVCADVHAIASTSPWYRGPMHLLASFVSKQTDRLQRRLIHWPLARVVTNGADLFAHYGSPRGRAVVSSTLSAREVMSVPRSRPADAPFRVLFVGYLRHEKGIDTLFAAFEKLLDEVPTAELFFVGSQNMEDRGMTEDLQRSLARLQGRATVGFLGHREFGPELFACFADADVLAVPSRSEGTPRVLVEARAFGCTVVASRVGGIPTSVEDEVDGLLVPPDDAAALYAALARLAQDRPLRERLRQAGIERARRTTVEAFAAAIAEEAAACLGRERLEPALEPCV
ncbi:MAG: glycosyltransferase family 4 protein [Pirellulales bacterium]|nr:glycosyltransferase family 4 protein [Pirellulales bacterium]